MNIIIITCPDLAPARLQSQLDQIRPYIQLNLISAINVICMSDSNARIVSGVPYCPEKWCSDITSAWDIFRQNFINCAARYQHLPVVLGQINPDRLFPPRRLTGSEHSVAMRHYIALRHAAESRLPSLILEDDALIANTNVFCEFLTSFPAMCMDRVYYDLADDYIPINLPMQCLRDSGILRYCFNPVAVTRTLMAYAVTPYTAQTILDSTRYYSLPIDMQLQSSLARLCMPGITLINSPFRHGSKSTLIPSSVRQF